jgi:mono/diheme cytochrome c family protein
VLFRSDASRRLNPLAGNDSAWVDGGRGFQDHCAVCHGEDGAGKSEIGKNLYPKAPDMRQPETQGLSDGELYFVIRNGVRYTGMPAWETEYSADDTWKLVSFIRRMPRLTPEEMDRVTAEQPAGEQAHGSESGPPTRKR